MKRLLALAVAFSSVASTALAAAAGGGEAAHGAAYPTAHSPVSLGLPTLVIFAAIIVLAAALGPGVARKAGPHPKDLDQH